MTARHERQQRATLPVWQQHADCPLCHVGAPLYRDDNGFYHDGPEDARIACSEEDEL